MPRFKKQHIKLNITFEFIIYNNFLILKTYRVHYTKQFPLSQKLLILFLLQNINISSVWFIHTDQQKELPVPVTTFQCKTYVRV